MSLWVIDKQKMAPFVAKMMGDYRVVGPVAKGIKFAFDDIEDPADLKLGYNTSILPPVSLRPMIRAGITAVSLITRTSPGCNN